jgi:hypothetical protein
VSSNPSAKALGVGVGVADVTGERLGVGASGPDDVHAPTTISARNTLQAARAGVGRRMLATTLRRVVVSR